MPREALMLAPSTEFMRALCHAGTVVAECGFCGRVHFVVETTLDYEEGELEDLLNKAESNPDKYIADYQSDSISVGWLDGKQVVWDCPCNKARRYEDWVWHHRDMIVEYLKNKVNSIVEDANREVDLIQNLDVRKVKE